MSIKTCTGEIVREKNQLTGGVDDPWNGTNLAGTHAILKITYDNYYKMYLKTPDRHYSRDTDIIMEKLADFINKGGIG